VTAPNAQLAYRVLDQIDAHPELWDQGVWIIRKNGDCGTAGCFAGWACLLSGASPYFDGDRPVTAYVMQDGVMARVEHLAEDLLGIDDGGELFDTANTREDLGRLVAEIFGPRPGGES